MPTLTTVTKHSTGSSSHCNKAKIRNQRHSDWKGEKKLLVFADDMIVCAENPKESAKNKASLPKTNKWVLQGHRM